MARRIEIEIVGDAKNFQKSLGQASGSADSFGSKLASLGKVAAVGLAALGAGAVFAGKKMITMAGNAAEVDSKMQVVFGKELPGLKKNLDSFADATGASSFKLREQAADMGALLGPLIGTKKGASEMSEQFVKLATDLGSFNNVPVDEALLAIRSGLVGEAEPLRRFGVLLNEAAVKAEGLRLGLVKGNEVMTEQQKVQARASLIMQQTTQAQGDATRTADSYANQMKALTNTVTDLATGLGVHLLPAATAIAGGLNDFINKISAAEGASAKFRVAMDALKDLAVAAGRGIRDAFNAIDWGAVGAALGSGLRSALNFLSGVDYGGILRTVASKVFSALQSAFGAIDWGAVGKTVGDLLVKALNGIAAFISRVNWNNVGQQLVQGFGQVIKALSTFLAGVDWGAVLVALSRGLLAVLQVQAKILMGVATAIGRAIVSGIGTGLSNLAGFVSEKLQAIPSAITGMIGTVSSLAVTLGRAIVQGAISGIQSLVGSLVDTARNMAMAPINAAKGILGIGSPSKVFAGIGEDTLRGFILGITTQIPALTEKTREAVTKAMEAAKATVERYQNVLGEAFSRLGDFVKRAFDAKTQNLLDNVTRKFDAQIARWSQYADALTPAEKELAALDKQEAQHSRDTQMRAAQDALAQAQAMEEGIAREQALAAAKEQIRLAELAQRRAQLEAQAEVERAAQEALAAEHIAKLEAAKARELTNLEERRRQLGEQLEMQLQTLVTSLAKHPEEHDKIQQKIQTLLKKYGIPMKTAGENLGRAFARGLREASDDVEKAAEHLAKIVQKYLQLKSPAEKGPLSSLNKWWDPMGPMLAKSMRRGAGALSGGASGVAGASVAGPRMAVAGGGGNVNHFHFPNYVGDKRELVQTIRTELSRHAARN